MRAKIGTVGIDYLTGYRRRIGHRKRIGKAQVGLLQSYFERVTVANFESGQWRVIIELARLCGLFARLVTTDDFALEQPRPRAFYRRIEQSFEAVGVVRGGKLTRLALERGIGGEEDSLANLANIGLAIILDDRERLECARHQFHGAREIIVIEHRFIDVGDDAVRRRVGGELGVEARFGDGEYDAQRFGGVGRARWERGDGRCQCDGD